MLIGVLSLIPLYQLPQTFDIWDKLQHFLAHGSLALLCYAGWTTSARSRQVSFLLAYAFSLELLQALIPERRFEWADMAANGLGVVLALILFRLGYYWFNRNSIRISDN